MPKELDTNTIQQELLKLNISPQLRAFEWITRAIQLCSQDKKLREQPVGQLYETLAQEYGYDSSVILQAIRRVIRNSWENREKYEEFSKVFGYCQNTDKIIAPLEFIVRVSDYLSKEYTDV